MASNLTRNLVLWWGPNPNADIENAFIALDLKARTLDALPTLDTLIYARGIVFWLTENNLDEIKSAIQKAAPIIANHGLQVYVVAETDKLQASVANIVKDLKFDLTPRYRTLPIDSLEIPKVMFQHDPQEAYSSSVEIKGDGLSPTDSVLLSRAFADCKKIVLEKLNGGRSANVYIAHATFKDSLVGPRPLPFFVKIDDRSHITTEIQNYKIYADHFIPYHLRPYLHYDRCIIGAEKGALVGTFVERSESLWNVVRRGHGQQAIHCLFDETLWGWRLQAYQSSVAIVTGPVAAGFSDEIFQASRVQAKHVEFAANKGITDTPQNLHDTLRSFTYQRYRKAPMHGDMHGNNTHVRGRDAIVLDLSMVQDGPIMGDLAALDTWLAFELPPESDSNQTSDVLWEKTIDALYDPQEMTRVPDPASEPNPYTWLIDSIRQIRLIAFPLQVCDTEYMTAIAVYLLRRTMYLGDLPADIYRRGYAYVTAARLVRAIDRILRA